MRILAGLINVCLAVMMVGFIALPASGQDVTVNSVTVRQRQPWSPKVDISYSVSASEPDADIYISLYGIEDDYHNIIPMRTLSGENVQAITVSSGGQNILTEGPVKQGDHVLVWDAGQDNPEFFTGQFKVRLEAYTHAALYMIVDVSGGPDAETYPITYLRELPDPIPDEYRTAKIALRYIPSGAFTIGSPEDEEGRSSNEYQRDVAISKGFFMGIFELTQAQWELVMGTTPWTYYVGGTRPAHSISFQAIRGAEEGFGWPEHNRVDTTSFMGKLRIKTGLGFDLPTEAQWEYACRAGTTLALNSGKAATDENMQEVGRFSGNDGPTLEHQHRDDTSGAIVLPDTNGDCSAARSLSLGELVTGNCANTSTGEAWFSFTPDSSGWYELSSCGSAAGTYTYVYVYDSCGGEDIDSNGLRCNYAYIKISYLQKEHTYIIKVTNSSYPYVFGVIPVEHPVLTGCTHVGMYLPNAWGLFDMHGNVSEWCLDQYSSTYFRDLPSPCVDPVGPTGSSSSRIFRGGSIGYGTAACRSAFRYYAYQPGSALGFRMCLPALQD